MEEKLSFNVDVDGFDALPISECPLIFHYDKSPSKEIGMSESGNNRVQLL